MKTDNIINFNHKHLRLLSLLPLAFLGLLLSCGGKGNGRQTSTSEYLDVDTATPLPESVREIATSIATDNPQHFASNVNYPLQRPYPLRDIEDSAQMVEYYETLVDDSLRNIVCNSTRKDWSRAGWRGWTLDAGQYIWIDEQVYSFPYLSKAELGLLKLAQERDLATIPKKYRKGWKPLFCLISIDKETLYRVDEKTDSSTYRLMVYPAKGNLYQEPRIVMEGEMKTEGSAANRIFRFSSSDGQSAEYLADKSDDTPLTIYLTMPGDTTTNGQQVTNAYWIDYVKPE